MTHEPHNPFTPVIQKDVTEASALIGKALAP